MRQNTALFFIVGIFISYKSISHAYLTDLYVDKKLYEYSAEYNANKNYGTHNNVTDYTINKITYIGGIKDKLIGVKGAIIQGNADEDDESFVNSPCHFYSPLLPYSQPGLFGLCEENAKLRANKYYEYAKKHYKDDQNGAWYKIGRSLHLLQDMAVPAHVHRSSHYQHAVIWKNGYEWWVARHWDDTTNTYQGFLIKPYLDYLFLNNPYFRRPIVAGDMGGYMDAMAIQAYYGYEYDYAPFLDPLPLVGINGPYVVSDDESRHTASIMVPSAIAIGGGLLQGFCKEVNCAGAPYPQPNNTNPGGNPDENFDVSSRLVELEELDVTKKGWKDLYGRTGIKKGYNEFFLWKIASEAYVQLVAATTEQEFNTTVQQIKPVADRVQKEAIHSFEETYYASADVAVLSDGFVDNAAELLLKRLKEPIREVKETFVPSALFPSQPVLLIPSGALSGFENSVIMKATLDEYVKQGGTLIVFAQAHGSDYAVLPTPNGKPLTAYGWEEDINCYSDSLYIDSWHQMFAGQSRSTPSVNVDGYFNGIPDTSTVLMRRSANGQPSLIMYEHGKGRVIATTMYTDWAYGHGQASGEEITLVRDILTWAKMPAQLPEAKAGEQVSLTMSVRNTTGSEATQVKALILSPDRSVTLYEQLYNQPIAAGQNVSFSPFVPTGRSWAPGIYHVDYLLLDASGDVIQPQAEADSGRFVLSMPPAELIKAPDYNFAVNSDSEHYAKGSDATFAVTLYNHTDTERTITAKYFFPHHYWESGGNGQYGGDWSRRDLNLTRTLTIPAKGSASFVHNQNVWANLDRLWAYFYDETGKEVGGASRGFYAFQPSATVSVSTDKARYARGETVAITSTLQNRQIAPTPVKLRIKASDPTNGAIYVNSLEVPLSANTAATQNMSFALPLSAEGGNYIISAEAFDSTDNKIGGDAVSFELPLSLVSLTPVIPAALTGGTNSISFRLNNVGKIDVRSGMLEVTLSDPDGVVAATISQPFALPVGQNLVIDTPLAVPPLKFGTYTLAYRQSDETRNGRTSSVTLENCATVQAVFDKSFYRVRESAVLTLNLANCGAFNPGNMAVTVSMVDAGFAETRIVPLASGQPISLSSAIAIPATIRAGQHLVQVSLAAPGGTALKKEFQLTVPESTLTATVPFKSLAAGETASVSIANGGGVDTQAEYSLVLADALGVQLVTKRLVETVPAGGSVNIPFTVPGGAADGNCLLLLNHRNTANGSVQTVNLPVPVQGVTADLTVRTGRQGYLVTDSINAAAHLANGTYPIEGGNLHLQAVTAGGNQVMKSWTSQSDFQQGSRSGVDTFETPDAVTLVAYSDNFNDGILDADRWWISYAPNAPQATEANGMLQLYFPWSPGGWQSTIAYTRTPLSADFDASVDYNIVTSWQPWSDNHPAGMLVDVPGWNTRIDVWGYYPTYGSIDSYGTYTNRGGAALNGKFRIRRVGSTYYMYFWNGSGWTNLINYSGRPVGPATLQLLDFGPTGNANVQYDNFLVSTQTYPLSGRLNLTFDAGRSEAWDRLSFTGDMPAGTSITFRTRTADTKAALGSAVWSSSITTSGAAITSTKGRWIEVEATLATTDTKITPKLYDLTVTQGRNPGDIVWQTDLPVSQGGGALVDLGAVVGGISTPGKYYLQGTLTSATGQTVVRAESPFYVAGGSLLVTLATGKRVYRPGEPVVIAGEIINNSTVDELNLDVDLNLGSGAEQTVLLDDTVAIPAGGSRQISATTRAGETGSYGVRVFLAQNSIRLAEVSDAFETAAPLVSAVVTAPELVGDAPFTVSLELKNSGKIDAVVTLTSSITELEETVTIPAGSFVLRSYEQQISATTTYSFTIAGDLTQTVLKQVSYGVSGTVTVTPQPLYSEGRVTVPVSISNSGPLDGRYTVSFGLIRDATEISRHAVEYVVAKGGVVADSITYDLPPGTYQLVVKGTLPAMTATAGFQVRKAIQVALALAADSQTSSGILPTRVELTNGGSNRVDGLVRLTVRNAEGGALVTAEQDVSLSASLQSVPQISEFNVNLAPVQPGDYTLRAELLGSDNQLLAQQAFPLVVRGATCALTQIPPYQTFPAGGNGIFVFTVRNSGNREGSCTLALKAGDLLDTSRTEWLKPGEEKQITFTVVLPVDLDEKDYSATYRLTGNGITMAEDLLRYRLAGLNLSVTAVLDRRQYRPGETAILNLQVDQQSGMATQELFARVHYNTHDEKRSFTLSGPQVLTFTVPLSTITGEKLFYGIYHRSGRSLYLNTLYVNAANDQLAITTDKEVYAPGESVTVSINGSATGNLVLTAPGDVSETMDFSGTASRSFTLPLDMTGGTYAIAATVALPNGDKVTASHPIDVAGLKVTIRDAHLDRSVIAATDTIRLTLTVESNRDLSAVLRVWVVDPSGLYTDAGEGVIVLNAALPLVVSQDALLATRTMGIHKLVYGVYRDNTLLVSGATAFDIGEALMTAVSTDKREYGGSDEQVRITANLFGTLSGVLDVMVDDRVLESIPLALNGFGSRSLTLPAGSITPGRHKVTALLTVGGLTSARETEFVYGSSLPDLTARLTTLPSDSQEVILSTIISNSGGNTAGACTLALYDGNPASGGEFIASVPVAALEPGVSVTLGYPWNLLGRSGDHVIFAVADYDNRVLEFDERNNSARALLTVPELQFSATIPKREYAANEEIPVSVALANLSPTVTYPDARVVLTLIDTSKASAEIAGNAQPLPVASAVNLVFSWNASSNPPGGYSLVARLVSGTTTLALQELGFSVLPTVSLDGSFTLGNDEVPVGSSLSIESRVTNRGNVEIVDGNLLLEIVDTSDGTTARTVSRKLDRLAVRQQITAPMVIDTTEMPPGEYQVRVSAIVSGERFTFGEKTLKVLQQVAIVHGVDLTPRVLVMAGGGYNSTNGSVDCKGVGEYRDTDGFCHHPVESVIRKVLDDDGIYSRITVTVDEFKREMRTGLYNIYLLAGNAPLTGHLDSELAERVYAGDGLIAIGYGKLNDVKMRNLTGVKSKGTLQRKAWPVHLLESPITQAGEMSFTGAPLKLEVVSGHPLIAGTINDSGKSYPAVVLNQYGKGKTVIIAFEGLTDLLQQAVSHVVPDSAEAIPGAPIGISVGLKSYGSPLELRVTESIPLPIIATDPPVAFSQGAVVWTVKLLNDELRQVAYFVELPENGGMSEATTEVAFARGGVYETYKTISHTIGTDRSLEDIRATAVNGITGLPLDRQLVDLLLKKITTIMDLPCQTTQQLDTVIDQLSALADELGTYGVVATDARFELDRLLRAYGRRWVNMVLQR